MSKDISKDISKDFSKNINNENNKITTIKKKTIKVISKGIPFNTIKKMTIRELLSFIESVKR